MNLNTMKTDSHLETTRNILLKVKFNNIECKCECRKACKLLLLILLVEQEKVDRKALSSDACLKQGSHDYSFNSRD